MINVFKKKIIKIMLVLNVKYELERLSKLKVLFLEIFL